MPARHREDLNAGAPRGRGAGAAVRSRTPMGRRLPLQSHHQCWIRRQSNVGCQAPLGKRIRRDGPQAWLQERRYVIPPPFDQLPRIAVGEEGRGGHDRIRWNPCRNGHCQFFACCFDPSVAREIEVMAGAIAAAPDIRDDIRSIVVSCISPPCMTKRALMYSGARRAPEGPIPFI